MKPQTHNEAGSLNINLWAITSLATDSISIDIFTKSM